MGDEVVSGQIGIYRVAVKGGRRIVSDMSEVVAILS
jgi:hypothetical protein